MPDVWGKLCLSSIYWHEMFCFWHCSNMQQQKENVSVTRLRDQFLLLSTRIDDEHNFILPCRKGVFRRSRARCLKSFSGGKPPDSNFSTACLSDRTIWQILFYLLKQICKITPLPPWLLSRLLPLCPPPIQFSCLWA